MVGKASLLVVAGFSLIFMIVAQNLGNVSTRAVENNVDYFNKTVAHNIAVAGANVAANEVFLSPAATVSISNRPFQGGKLDVSMADWDVIRKIREITSIGTYNGISDTVRIKIAPSKFSEFAYYSVYERSSPTGANIWWTGSDTVWGPFHTQDNLRAAFHPVFLGKKTTIKGDLIYYDRDQWGNYISNMTTRKNLHQPVVTGEWDSNVDLRLDSTAVDSFDPIADAGGLKFTGTATGNDTIYMTFDNDTLRYRFQNTASDTAVYLPAVAPNGLIFAKNYIVRLKGVVKGQYTVGVSAPSSGSKAASKGTVFLDDNIVLSKDPNLYPTSTDILGICAENSVLITQNSVNNNSIDIQASIYCEKGGFGAQNYDTRPVSGSINLLGGIQQYWRKAVGTFSGSTINHGFSKKYRYDQRLAKIAPPHYPGTGGFKIVSWLE